MAKNKGLYKLTQTSRIQDSSPILYKKEKDSAAGTEKQSKTPAAEFGARTATQNHTQGGDILSDGV
ncbi:MAG TPA: hypothetical protein VFR94_23505 [Nitrososphaeraceae archaeon]|nr:hypothetical protein [Nitrososphaeraceae archaeon]